MTTIEWACHRAHLDEMAGIGMLVRPNDLHDVALGSPTSLHAADWDHAIAELYSRGWEPLESSPGELTIHGHTADGRTVVALYGRHPIVSQPSIQEMSDATSALAEICGIEVAS